MPIHPELANMVAFLPQLDLEDIAASRDAVAQAAVIDPSAPLPDWLASVNVTDRLIPGQEDPDIPVRLYRGHGEGVRPALVYFHGGAFVLGGVGAFDGLCAAYATQADLVVVSVDYRLAPEDPYPAGPEDCYAALVWVAEHAEELHIDPAGIAVGGSSAGGALAAAVSLMARDRHGPAVAFQMLLNPVLDDRIDTVSARGFPTTPMWNSTDLSVMWDRYLGANRRHVSPYAAPARASDLSGLPPAYILTSEFDPLRDEGIAYALRLLQAGVPVELHNFAGTFHAFDMMPTTISGLAVAEQHVVLRRALHGP